MPGMFCALSRAQQIFKRYPLLDFSAVIYFQSQIYPLDPLHKNRPTFISLSVKDDSIVIVRQWIQYLVNSRFLYEAEFPGDRST